MNVILGSDDNKIMALTELEASLGWVVIVNFLRENVRELGEDILNDIDDAIPKDEKTKLILKRHYQQKLIDMPKLLKEYIKNSKAVENPDIKFDPFE